MAIQLSNLAASFFPNRASMHKTAIFEEIADLYKTDRVEFNKLLTEAHKVADDSIKIEPKTNSACKIDFNNSLNLSFTQPESVVYFGERKNEFGSWTDCYKYIMRCLYGDFPHIISALAKDSSYSLISNEAGLLRRPVRIVDNIFAEGNRSATDLMKHIKVMLDKCGVNYENLTYEGYGPSGVAIIVDTLTDNKNRTAANVRSAFTKGGGNVGTPGSVSYMFDKKGQIIIDKEECEMDADELMMAALDAGAEDFSEEEDSYEVITAPDDFSAVREALEALKIPMMEADVTMIPQTWVELSNEDDIKKLNRILDLLDEDDDVQAVYHNWDE